MVRNLLSANITNHLWARHTVTLILREDGGSEGSSACFSAHPNTQPSQDGVNPLPRLWVRHKVPSVRG
jgi:hypothetical protein